MNKTNEEYIKQESEESQCAKILEHLKKGLSITPLEALNLCGCFRLSARIWNLRHEQGYNIITERVKTSSGKYVAQYRLAS